MPLGTLLKELAIPCRLAACIGLWMMSAMPAAGAGAPGHAQDAHAHHATLLQQAGYTRTRDSYRVPDVTLIDQDGARVRLRGLLDGSEPVMLNFIFTTCTTICPVLSAGFSAVQQHDPAADGMAPRLVSISIDPEHDTPARLLAYAARFRAGDDWTFLTGSLEDVTAVLKAFDSYRRDKMNHIPVTFLRTSPAEPWTRIEGFASAGELLGEYRAALTHARAGSDDAAHCSAHHC